MRSDLPKVVHTVVGRPMVEHVVRTAGEAGAERIVVVVGYGADVVREALAAYDVTYVEQSVQRGTGHAVACARDALQGQASAVAVLYGDGPALRPSTLRDLAAHVAGPPASSQRGVDRPGMALATVTRDDAGGFGRIVRSVSGDVERIVEQADATPEEAEIREVNPGIYVFDEALWTHLDGVDSGNAQGEIYLTDVVAQYRRSGSRVLAVPIEDASEAMAANDRAQLAELEALLQRRILAAWMERGVTFVRPTSTVVHDDVRLAADVVVGPFTVLAERTVVGARATIGSHVALHACTVAEGATVASGTVARSEHFA